MQHKGVEWQGTVLQTTEDALWADLVRDIFHADCLDVQIAAQAVPDVHGLAPCMGSLVSNTSIICSVLHTLAQLSMTSMV